MGFGWGGSVPGKVDFFGGGVDMHNIIMNNEDSTMQAASEASACGRVRTGHLGGLGERQLPQKIFKVIRLY